MREVPRHLLKEPDAFIRPDDKLLSRRGLRTHLSRYSFAAQFVGDAAVLDLACGAGYGSAYLMKRGARSVIGGDVSPQAIALANRYYVSTGVEYRQIDATDLPFRDAVFDVVVSLETIEHLDDQERFLREVVRVLRPSGTLVLSTPNRDIVSPGSDKPLWPFHTREFRTSELGELLAGFFGQVRLWGQTPAERYTRLRTRLASDFMLISKGILKKVPAGHRLLKLATAFWFRDLTPVDMTQVDSFEEQVGYLEPALALDPRGKGSPRMTHILAVAREPRQ
jgi:SAM-dependent methyltransferase